MNLPPADSRDRADQDLTILLTLKDRSEFTLRWMEYANSIAFPFKVLIADGGLDDRVQTMLAEKARFPDVDYEYVRYPPDNTYADYYTKLEDALGRVRTPFVAMADNDDFFVVKSLRAAVRFLAANSDYFSCGGQGAIFWMGSTRRPDANELVHGSYLEWKCTREMRSVDADTTQERLQSVSVSKSDTHYYDVKRSQEARRQFGLVREMNLRDLFLVEHSILYLSAIAGKAKRLDQLYLARQQDSPGSAGGAHANQFGDWFGRMLVPSWSEDFGKFLSVVSAALADADDVSRDEAMRCVVRSYRAAVTPPLLSDLMDEPSVTVSMSTAVAAIRRTLKLPENSALRGLARKFYRRFKWISPDIVFGTEFLATPVLNAESDFEPIRDFLMHAR